MISSNRSRHVPIHKVVESFPVAKAAVHPAFVARDVWAAIHESPVPVQSVLIAVEKALEICIKIVLQIKIAICVRIEGIAG